MVHALAAGCEAVIPCGEIDEAKEIAASLPAGTALLVGERQGLPIPGFDLGNSPGDFTPEVCAGKDAGHDHDQRHPGDSGQPRGRAGLHRQLREPAGDIERAVGPVPQERPQAFGPHRLRGNRGHISLEDSLLAGALAGEIAKGPGENVAELFGNDEALMVVCQWNEVRTASWRSALSRPCLSLGRGGKNVRRNRPGSRYRSLESDRPLAARCDAGA